MDGHVGGTRVRLADTDLDVTTDMPRCCVESFADFAEGAGEVVVVPGQEFVCPTCGGYTTLDELGEWRYAGGDDSA
jgi:hypothetical protein